MTLTLTLPALLFNRGTFFSALVSRNCLNFSTACSQKTMETLNDDTLDPVKIDETGTFKYIMVCVKWVQRHEGDRGITRSDSLVRGYGRCYYHGDILEEVEEEVRKILGTRLQKIQCLGGGRIEREGKKVEIYGYSQGYGRADHKLAQTIIKKKYPDLDVSWNNDGY